MRKNKDKKISAGKVVQKKIRPEYFIDVVTGKKRFELRRDEDDIQPGDILVLQEFNGRYTGAKKEKVVKYVLRNVPEYGLIEGYCIIGW